MDKTIVKTSIYICQDNRTRIYIVFDDKTHKIMSYPKFLMEQYIGRPLEPYEDVHHIDGDTLNNDISNLEIKNHGEHQKEHSTKYYDKITNCD